MWFNSITGGSFTYVMEHLWDLMGVGKITRRIVIEVIEKIVAKKKRINKTYLIKDE